MSNLIFTVLQQQKEQFYKQESSFLYFLFSMMVVVTHRAIDFRNSIYFQIFSISIFALLKDEREHFFFVFVWGWANNFFSSLHSIFLIALVSPRHIHLIRPEPLRHRRFPHRRERTPLKPQEPCVRNHRTIINAIPIVHPMRRRPSRVAHHLHHFLKPHVTPDTTDNQHVGGAAVRNCSFRHFDEHGKDGLLKGIANIGGGEWGLDLLGGVREGNSGGGRRRSVVSRRVLLLLLGFRKRRRR